MNKSRVENSIKNSSITMFVQIVSILLQFVLRSIFIKTLGIEYLGINGLFINILSVLSLSELGVGSAIIYSMYKPIANEDYEKINKYMNLYKKIYFVIGCFIFCVGLMVIPFLDILVTKVEEIDNLVIIYILFLINSVSTYFFAHYRSLLTAYQKDYINNINRLLFLIVQIIMQLAILLVYESFIGYLVVQIIMNFSSNFVIAKKVKKEYPQIIKTKYENLEKAEVVDVLKNSIAMFSQKIGYVVLNSTDNIIISMLIGTGVVGVYSNYSLIIGTLSTLLSMVVCSIGASIGNLIANNDNEKSREVFLKINFMYFLLYGMCTVCLYNLIPDFIGIWVGKELLLAKEILLVIIINFYITGMRQSVLSFTNASGVFWEMRYKPLFEVIINLIISFVLVNKIGLLGVFIGTLVSLLTTSFWYEPYILYKFVFKVKNNEYFKRYCTYTIALIIINFVIGMIIGPIKIDSFIMFILKGILCFILFIGCISICFCKTREYKYILNLVNNILKKMKKKVKS